MSRATSVIRAFVFVLSPAIITVTSCLPADSSRTKSFVGLEADLDPRVLKGEAPSFQLLQQWFRNELPIDRQKVMSGNPAYQVYDAPPSNFTDLMPDAFRQQMVQYLRQQASRVALMQEHQTNKSKLEELLNLEAKEMQDILLALISTDYVPVTDDLLARMVAHQPLRNFIDRYSVNLLEKLYARSLRSLIANMPKESENFAKLLAKTYIGPNGANDRFIAQLAANCSKIHSMLSSLGATSSLACKGSATTMNLNEGSSPLASASDLGGPVAKILGIFGGVVGSKGYATTPVKPNLRVFAGKDPDQGDPYDNNSTNDAGPNPTNPAKKPEDPNKIPQTGVASLFKDMSVNNQTSSNNQANTNNKFYLANTARGETLRLPPASKGQCKDKTGMELVVCRRFIETLPAPGQLTNGVSQKSVKPESPEFNFAGTYRMFLISKYATRVLNQGVEGACSAFANTHVIGVLARTLGKPGEYNAWDLWRQQGRLPYLSESIAAAKKMSFDGLKISSASPLQVDLKSFKAQINAGRPIYIGSDIDSSWNGSSDGRLRCEGYSTGGHAYAIMGYDDSSNVFIIKNSWGDSWGDQGYGYLSYSCLNKMGTVDAYDIRLK